MANNEALRLTQINRDARQCVLPPLTLDQKKLDDLDRNLHAKLSLFFSLSPSAIALAYADWYLHLCLSPSKQIELTHSAWEKARSFWCYFGQSLSSKEMQSCTYPQGHDRRFQSKAWDRQPYHAYQQFFLLLEEWLQQATSGVRGVTKHHNAVLPFITRQFVDLWSPLNFPFTNPLVVDATLEKGGANFIKGFQNFMEDWDQVVNGKPPVGAEKFKVGKQLAVTNGKVIYQNRLIELIQYSPTTKTVHPEPILIVPAWIMKYYILDLSPHNSLVKYMVDQGHTVFIISWRNPDASDRDLGMEDYLNLGVMDAVAAINEIVPGRKIHATGYCLGGTILSIAAAKMARDGDDRLKTVTLLAAQVDFEDAGELLLFVDESQITFLEDVMWEKGYLDSNRMAGAFYMLRPYDLIWSRVVESYYLGERAPMSDLMAWNADATRMPYRMHSEYLRKLFLQNQLTNGHFMIEDKSIILNDIRVPIFAVGTVRDHVAPWVSVYKVMLYTDTDVTFILTSGGHNAGIVSEPGHPRRAYQISTHKEGDNHLSPKEWQKTTPIKDGSWWPEWHKWLTQSSGNRVKSPQMGNPEKGYKPLRSSPGKYVLQ